MPTGRARVLERSQRSGEPVRARAQRAKEVAIDILDHTKGACRDLPPEACYRDELRPCVAVVWRPRDEGCTADDGVACPARCAIGVMV